MILAVAPLQGFTEAPFRNCHSRVYPGSADYYFTPFMRVEHGEVRKKDMRDILSSPDLNSKVLPQAICRDAVEFESIAVAVREAGYRHLDLNLGCPYPPQVKRGRGAGMLDNPAMLASIRDVMKRMDDMEFSVKMRLGVHEPDGWRNVMPVIESMPLAFLTVHPRVAVQQYRGDLHMDEIERLMGETSHRIIYNGNIAAPSDIEDVKVRYPSLWGVMAGRGLLSRPSLFAEWREGVEWDHDLQLDYLKKLHEGIYGCYCAKLCGEAQILSKMKPFWEYLEPLAGRRCVKKIRKSNTLADYMSSLPWC